MIKTMITLKRKYKIYSCKIYSCNHKHTETIYIAKKHPDYSKDQHIKNYILTVLSEDKLTNEQINTIGNIYNSFNIYSSYEDLDKSFKSFDISKYDAKLLKITVNGLYGNGTSILGRIAEVGAVSAAKKLLEMGADPNLIDGWKKSPLHYAISDTKSTADVHNFMYECNGKTTDMVDFLLSHGAKANTISDENSTALEYAKNRGYKDAVSVIENFPEEFTKRALNGLFFLIFNTFPVDDLPKQAAEIATVNIDFKTARAIACVNKFTYNLAMERSITQQTTQENIRT